MKLQAIKVEDSSFKILMFLGDWLWTSDGV